jgi:hypothetical protein
MPLKKKRLALKARQRRPLFSDVLDPKKHTTARFSRAFGANRLF